MSTDTSRSPDATDPGLRQNNQQIGSHAELTLPDVVPLIEPTGRHTTRVGILVNEVWIRNHWFWRGVFGTTAEWFTFFVGAAAQYPKVSVIGLAVFAVLYEENYSKNPVVTNTIQYAMESYDPVAAEKIFRPEVIEKHPIDVVSEKLLTDVTAEFLDSVEYATLRADVEQGVHRQVRIGAYEAAGMREEADEVREDARRAREARRVKLTSDSGPTPTQDPALPEPLPVPAPSEGQGPE